MIVQLIARHEIPGSMLQECGGERPERLAEIHVLRHVSRDTNRGDKPKVFHVFGVDFWVMHPRLKAGQSDRNAKQGLIWEHMTTDETTALRQVMSKIIQIA